MAKGYLSSSSTVTTGMSYEAMLYCKTNIGGYFFDGFINVNHTRKLKVTSNPVETGASIVDHAFVEPAVITMQVMMSDVHRSLVSGQFEGSWSRSVEAWKVLKKLQQDRIPCSVLTRLDKYDNMLITSITSNDTASTIKSLVADVELTEIPVARVRTVKISAAPQITVETEMGKLEAVSASAYNGSMLSSIAGYTLDEIGSR